MALPAKSSKCFHSPFLIMVRSNTSITPLSGNYFTPRLFLWHSSRTWHKPSWWRGDRFIYLTGYSPTLREVRTGNKKQKLKQRPWRNYCSPLAFHSLLSLLSYTAKDNILRCDDAHSGLGPTTLIIKHWPDWWRQFDSSIKGSSCQAIRFVSSWQLTSTAIS